MRKVSEKKSESKKKGSMECVLGSALYVFF